MAAAAYQLSASIGVFAAGFLSTISWQFLFLIPAVTIIFLPILNYVVSPFYNAIGGALYNMDSSQVSTYLVWAFVCAAIVGTSSGVIIGKIGRQAGIITAACLIVYLVFRKHIYGTK